MTDDARRTHAADQLGAHLRATAKILGEYRRELVTQDFTPDQVAQLCVAAQAELIGALSRKSDGADG